MRVPSERVEALRESLGELPAAIRKRLQTQYGIKSYDADVIVNQGTAMIGYFETAAQKSGDGKRTSSWLLQDIMRTMNDEGIEDIGQFKVDANTLGDLLGRVTAGDLDNARARDVFAHLYQHGGAVGEAIAALGIKSVDNSELDALCRDLLAANPQ